ncbi:MAG: YybH family protein [Betaproteobacteria bacterium]
MKIRRGVFVLVALLGSVPAVWAQGDPIKEVAAIQAKRGQANAKCDLDGIVSNVADNVVFTPGRAGFRIEGKAAMRAYFAQICQNYPTRQFLARQFSARAFNNGTVVVRNWYSDTTAIDRNGYLSASMTRTSQTWVKTDGQWLLVDQHVSRMPAGQ